MATNVLSVWTVYDHPRDFPHCYVARRFETSAEGERATGDIVIAPSLDDIRDQMERLGLVCLMRSDEDDPVIVETWL